MRWISGGWSRFATRLGLLLVLAVAAGCGPGRGKVSGRVLYRGAPLPGGVVTFRPADARQNPVSAPIDEEGRYEAVLPVGEVAVSIDNRMLRPRANVGAGLTAGLPLPPELRKKPETVPPEPDRAAPTETDAVKPPGRYVEIPYKYYQMETSNLRFAVSGGDQPHDIGLTD
jgi:hypothetical protein